MAIRVWHAIGWIATPHLLSYHDLWTLDDLPDSTTPAVRSTIITDVLWNIWKTRNALVFNGLYITASATVRNVAANLRLWAYRCMSHVDSSFLLPVH
uniref:Uncharacterized protein n=1 Tax=Setaria viridis TaxID=4556 RepID=A0A4U6UNC1_SETVI|nr:hypothetical protein SEVIR_5G239500v2 [Setaria viridis]